MKGSRSLLEWSSRFGALALIAGALVIGRPGEASARDSGDHCAGGRNANGQFRCCTCQIDEQLSVTECNSTSLSGYNTCVVGTLETLPPGECGGTCTPAGD